MMMEKFEKKDHHHSNINKNKTALVLKGTKCVYITRSRVNALQDLPPLTCMYVRYCQEYMCVVTLLLAV